MLDHLFALVAVFLPDSCEVAFRVQVTAAWLWHLVFMNSLHSASKACQSQEDLIRKHFFVYAEKSQPFISKVLNCFYLLYNVDKALAYISIYFSLNLPVKPDGFC